MFYNKTNGFNTYNGWHKERTIFLLKDNETLEDLGLDGLKLIQSDQFFKFGTDAVLLADFAKVKPTGCAIDLCTGSGIVPLLLSARFPLLTIEALELSEDMADMARRSVAISGRSEQIHITCGDVLNVRELYRGRQFDLVCCNPPYQKKGSGRINPNAAKAAARHELFCTLEDVVSAAAYLTKPCGTFAMVHRPERLTDILHIMRTQGLEPKRLILVADRPKKAPDLVLVEGRRGGRAQLTVETLYIEEKKHGWNTVSLRDTHR